MGSRLRASSIGTDFTTSDTMMKTDYYSNCMLCPRGCGTDRHTSRGFCGCTDTVRAARAGLHFFEEPFLSGEYLEEDDPGYHKRGSGAVFFSGCNLQCIFCQNHDISGRDSFGAEISAERLAEIFLELQSYGAYNINLVTGTPYIPDIVKALHEVRNVTKELRIPVVWNSSGYESVESLEMLEGLVDIWLPDLKTLSPELGQKYMNAPDYPDTAKEVISWMVSQAPEVRFVRYGSDNEKVEKEPVEHFLEKKSNVQEVQPGESDYEQNEAKDLNNMIMTSGVCVRHMVMPGYVSESKRVLEYLYETYGSSIYVSLMSQYTPMRTDFQYKELNRRLTKREYARAVDFAISLGMENCMIQEGRVASESFIPEFDGSGIEC